MRFFLHRALIILLAALFLVPAQGRAEGGKPLPGSPGYTDYVRLRPSKLPIPVAPPVPPKRVSFDIPRADPTVDVARKIADRVDRFPNRRSRSPAAEWRETEAVRFAVRGRDACLSELVRLGMPTVPVAHGFASPVAVPVALTGPVNGVAFVRPNRSRKLEVACELAVRLPAMAEVLRAIGVTEVMVASAYRDRPFDSFHTFALALDIGAFVVDGERLLVARDFEIATDARTCEAVPATGKARDLQRIACALAKSDLLSTVITPNYNEGHRDHFHLDIRPDDPRIFVR